MAFSIHAILPLVSHTLDIDVSSVLFEGIEQDDDLSESDLNDLTVDFGAFEYTFALQYFDQKVAAPALFCIPANSVRIPPYIAFRRLKIDC
jgi:hypothetical protein